MVRIGGDGRAYEVEAASVGGLVKQVFLVRQMPPLAALDRPNENKRQVGDDDAGARIALLMKPRGLDRRLAHVAKRVDHAVDLDLKLSAQGRAFIRTAPHARHRGVATRRTGRD